MGAKVDLRADAVTVTGPGRLEGITVDLYDSSDTMPTLAAIAPLAAGPVRIENIYNTRVKECDRLQTCADNLTALGVKVETGRDWIESPRHSRMRAECAPGATTGSRWRSPCSACASPAWNWMTRDA